MQPCLIRSLFGLLLMLGGLSGAQADAYHVTLDTSSLFANLGNAPFALNFQLIDGDTASNTINITNVLFGGGSATNNPATIGGASGSLSTNVQLQDISFLNDFTEDFTPGSMLEFDLLFTSNFAGGPTPDRFTLGLSDSSGSIPTTGSGDALLGIDLTGLNPSVEVYALTGGTYSGGVSVTAVPELKALALPAFLLMGGGALWHRRRQNAR